MHTEAHSRTSLEDGRHAIMVENLFYLLSGVDTTHMRIGVRDKRYALVVDPTYPPQLVLPFESLAINIRVVSKFVLKSQYSSDTVKEIVADCFETKVSKYLENLMALRLREWAIETLAVGLRGHIEEFDEMRRIVDDANGMSGIGILNYLEERKGQAVHFKGFYEELIRPCVERVREEVDRWVTEGLLPISGFMVRRNEVSGGFTESVWTHQYTIVGENVPYFLEEHKNQIYNCGRIINIGKTIFKRNIFGGSTREYKGLGIVALDTYLSTQLVESLRNDLETELDVMHKCLLMNESSLYLDMLEELVDETFSPSERTIAKMNAIMESGGISGIVFKKSLVPANEYILKILNVQAGPTKERCPTILEIVTIEYAPRVLGHFLSPKTLSELEIIFRFLFTLTGLSYHMGRLKKIRFARIALMVVESFRFSIHSGMRHVEVKSSMDHIMATLLSSIRKYLRELYLTSEKGYHAWSVFFDLCFDFLDAECKSSLGPGETESFESKLFESIEGLKRELGTAEYNDLFVYFLGSTQWTGASANAHPSPTL